MWHVPSVRTTFIVCTDQHFEPLSDNLQQIIMTTDIIVHHVEGIYFYF